MGTGPSKTDPCKVTIMKNGFMEEQIRRYTGRHKTSAQIKIPVVIKTMPDA